MSPRGSGKYSTVHRALGLTKTLGLPGFALVWYLGTGHAFSVVRRVALRRVGQGSRRRLDDTCGCAVGRCTPTYTSVQRDRRRYHCDVEDMAARGSNRVDRGLDRLRATPALGPLVRFYFRRREQLLYLLVGGWNTVFGYAAWAIMQYLLGGYVNYLVVIVLAWPVNVLNAYAGYRYVVFRSRGPVLRELPRFSLVYLAALVANLVLLPLALRVLPFSIYVVQAIFAGVVVVSSYLGHKHFSFRGRRRSEAHDSPARIPTAKSKG